MSSPTPIEKYDRFTFSHVMRNGIQATHDVYTQGSGDKLVVIIQELPGIGQETLALADRFVGQGFRVVLPHLFGPIGRTAKTANLLRVFCMRKEFKLFARHESSPIVDFLSALCSHVCMEYKMGGVAVIGMCLTGNFAISLMANKDVLAAYASQPSLPGLSHKSIHMSQAEIRNVKTALDHKGAMHCGRFEGDRLCRQSRFSTLRDTFNDDGHERIIFHELPGQGHAILTLDYVDDPQDPSYKMLQQVIQYFDDRLG